MVLEQILVVLATLLAGLYYGALRYFTEYLNKGEAFEPSKFLRAIFIGLILGAIALYYQVTIASADALFMASFVFVPVVAFLDRIVVPFVLGLLVKLGQFVGAHS